MQLLLNDFQDCILLHEQETHALLCGGGAKKTTVSVLYLTSDLSGIFNMLTHWKEIK